MDCPITQAVLYKPGPEPKLNFIMTSSSLAQMNARIRNISGHRRWHTSTKGNLPNPAVAVRKQMSASKNTMMPCKKKH